MYKWTDGTDYLSHHGIKGQKWGIRRFQNEDGSYTAAGRERRRVDGRNSASISNELHTNAMGEKKDNSSVAPKTASISLFGKDINIPINIDVEEDNNEKSAESIKIANNLHKINFKDSNIRKKLSDFIKDDLSRYDEDDIEEILGGEKVGSVSKNPYRFIHPDTVFIPSNFSRELWGYDFAINCDYRINPEDNIFIVFKDGKIVDVGFDYGWL